MHATNYSSSYKLRTAEGNHWTRQANNKEHKPWCVLWHRPTLCVRHIHSFLLPHMQKLLLLIFLCAFMTQSRLNSRWKDTSSVMKVVVASLPRSAGECWDLTDWQTSPPSEWCSHTIESMLFTCLHMGGDHGWWIFPFLIVQKSGIFCDVVQSMK